MSTYSTCSVKLAGSWKLLPGEPGVRKLIISIMVTGIWSGNAVIRELAGRTLLSGFFFPPFGTGCQNQRTIKPSGALGFPLDSHLADLVQAAGHSVSLPLVHCLYNGSGSSRPRLWLRMRTPALGPSASCGCGTVQDHGSDLGKETRGCAGTCFIVLYIFLWNIYTSENRGNTPLPTMGGRRHSSVLCSSM